MKHYVDLVEQILTAPLVFIINYYADDEILKRFIRTQTNKLDKNDIISIFNIRNVNEIKAAVGNIAVLYYDGFIDRKTVLCLCSEIDRLHEEYLSLPVIRQTVGSLAKDEAKAIETYEAEALRNLSAARKKIHDFYIASVKAGNLAYGATNSDSSMEATLLHSTYASKCVSAKRLCSYYRTISNDCPLRGLGVRLYYSVFPEKRGSNHITDKIDKYTKEFTSRYAISKRPLVDDLSPGGHLDILHPRNTNLSLTVSCPSEFGMYVSCIRDDTIGRIGQQMTLEENPWTNSLQKDIVLVAECDFLVYLCEVSVLSENKAAYNVLKEQKAKTFYSALDDFLAKNPTLATEQDYYTLQRFVEKLSAGIKANRKERRK